MVEKANDSMLKYLKDSVYCNVKKKIIPIILRIEFNMLMFYFQDITILRAFYLREMYGIFSIKYYNDTQFSKDQDFFLIIPKRKGDLLEIKEFMINNIISKNIFNNNYIFKGKFIYKKRLENYMTGLFRFIALNKEIKKNKKENAINLSPNLKIINFIDVIISLYLDINDNSTVIINELFYDLDEAYFSRFNDVIEIYYKKLKMFLEKNFNKYFCNESILINRSILQVFNYIMSTKLFSDKRFEINNIQKQKDEINILVDIKDKIYPDTAYKIICNILKLSEISSFITIKSLIDIKYLSLNERFNILKSGIIFGLKSLKKNIEKEAIA